MNSIVLNLTTPTILPPPVDAEPFANSYSLPTPESQAVLRLPQLSITASETLSISVPPGDAQRPLLILPFFRSVPHLGAYALWLPSGSHSVNAARGAKVVLELETSRLNRTAHALSLPMGDSSAKTFGMSISLMANGQDFGRIFQALLQLIDAHNWDNSALALLNLDELIYRQIVLLLHAARPLEKIVREERSFKCQLIDELCNKLLSRLHLPIALPDIESLSGISARGLQYAFQERFGCTPMAWVREQRLLMARERLLRESSTVMEVAVACGFRSSSLFTRYYQARFGEAPSNTLKQKR